MATQTEKTFTASSNVSKIEYDEAHKVMTITFTNGSKYDYSGVPESVWQEALTATSIGSFVSQNIKGTYPYSRV